MSGWDPCFPHGFEPPTKVIRSATRSLTGSEHPPSDGSSESFDLYMAFAQGRLTQDPLLQSGDVITSDVLTESSFSVAMSMRRVLIRLMKAKT